MVLLVVLVVLLVVVLVVLLVVVKVFLFFIDYLGKSSSCNSNRYHPTASLLDQ